VESFKTEDTERISFDEFSKVHLTVGKILDVEAIPGMKKVFKSIVDIGYEKREIVVGAALHYKPQDLIGKTVVVCTNLQQRKIGNTMSNGMILAAAGQDGKPIFLTTTDDISPGAKIH